MLDKEIRKALNSEFWDAFKKEMRQHNSKFKTNTPWLSYPTGIKNVFLRMEVNQHGAFLNFDVQFKDKSIRDIFWEQLCELKKVMHSHMSFDGDWKRDEVAPEGFVFDRIQWASTPLSFYDKNDWKAISHFLKHRLIEFDAFYQEFKDILILLVK